MTDLSGEFSRRRFIAQTSCFGAFYATAQLLPLPAFAQSASAQARVSHAPVADKGFASVHKIGEGLYGTISDPSKGTQTVSNGGFLIGKDAALVIEGFISAVGAAFQMEALRTVTQLPVQCALDTHYHYDHSSGNSFYGAHGIPIWAHAQVASRIVGSYLPWQGAEKSVALAGLERRVRDSKTDLQREHAQGDLAATTNVFNTVNATVLALPSHPLDPAKLPMTIDLGGLQAIIETHPGHSGTDLIVRVPEQKVVYTGDLLFNGIYPVTFDEQATISGWRATLAKFAAYDEDTVFVPGHGQICGQEVVARFRQAFDDIAEQAEKMFKAGVPVQEATERYVVPERFKNLAVFAWGFTIAPTIAKLYAEWQNK